LDALVQSCPIFNERDSICGMPDALELGFWPLTSQPFTRSHGD
jgi:hypothetical protein